MSRVSLFSSPFLVGFDELERRIERASKAGGDGYPPCNIERFETDGRLRITLAVAGFAAGDLDVSVEDNELMICGRQREDGARAYLHRGIAARQFHRAFVLADGIRVVNAGLANGLLAIDLERPQLERVIRKIEITGASKP